MKASPGSIGIGWQFRWLRQAAPFAAVVGILASAFAASLIPESHHATCVFRRVTQSPAGDERPVPLPPDPLVSLGLLRDVSQLLATAPDPIDLPMERLQRRIRVETTPTGPGGDLVRVCAEGASSTEAMRVAGAVVDCYLARERHSPMLDIYARQLQRAAEWHSKTQRQKDADQAKLDRVQAEMRGLSTEELDLRWTELSSKIDAIERDARHYAALLKDEHDRIPVLLVSLRVAAQGQPSPGLSRPGALQLATESVRLAMNRLEDLAAEHGQFEEQRLGLASQRRRSTQLTALRDSLKQRVALADRECERAGAAKSQCEASFQAALDSAPIRYIRRTDLDEVPKPKHSLRRLWFLIGALASILVSCVMFLQPGMGERTR